MEFNILERFLSFTAGFWFQTMDYRINELFQRVT
jgi:hypothetical protein